MVDHCHGKLKKAAENSATVLLLLSLISYHTGDKKINNLALQSTMSLLLVEV
jgi:hypothetical protein